jgi:hypothetical protein
MSKVPSQGIYKWSFLFPDIAHPPHPHLPDNLMLPIVTNKLQMFKFISALKGEEREYWGVFDLENQRRIFL